MRRDRGVRRPRRVRPRVVLLIGSLVLALGGVAQAVCPPEFLFGCTVIGSAVGPGLHVRNDTGDALTGFSVGGNGVFGQTDSAVFPSAGVSGFSNSGTGVIGRSGSGTGVIGRSEGGVGINGFSTSFPGVYGSSANNNGVAGFSSNAHGVDGRSTNSNGVFGQSDGGAGVRGESFNNHGVDGRGTSNHGVFGQSDGGAGVKGESINNDGVAGVAHNDIRAGVSGSHPGGGYGIYGESTNLLGFAGYFYGDVAVSGTLSKAAGSFTIDHPLDPANKTLSHSFVESPDMLNIYNGHTLTDAHGNATITLPAYFQALNYEFRYQLTVIEQFAQAMVASKIQENQFTIKTDKPHVEVSWMVTGVRQDAYANAHRIVVEDEKPAQERGAYLHPAVYGQPKTKGMPQARWAGEARPMSAEAPPAQAAVQP